MFPIVGSNSSANHHPSLLKKHHTNDIGLTDTKPDRVVATKASPLGQPNSIGLSIPKLKWTNGTSPVDSFSACFFFCWKAGGKNNTTKLGVVVYWEKLPSPNLCGKVVYWGKLVVGFIGSCGIKVAWRGSHSRPGLCEDLRRKFSAPTIFWRPNLWKA